MTSPVQLLKAEIEAIAQACMDLRLPLENTALKVGELNDRWNNTGLSANVTYYDSASTELARFHTDLRSASAAAFQVGVFLGLVGEQL